jgi:hypothetical protein
VLLLLYNMSKEGPFELAESLRRGSIQSDNAKDILTGIETFVNSGGGSGDGGGDDSEDGDEDDEDDDDDDDDDSLEGAL